MLTLNIQGEPVPWRMATLAPRHRYKPPPHIAWQELIRLQVVMQLPKNHRACEKPPEYRGNHSVRSCEYLVWKRAVQAMVNLLQPPSEVPGE